MPIPDGYFTRKCQTRLGNVRVIREDTGEYTLVDEKGVTTPMGLSFDLAKVEVDATRGQPPPPKEEPV